MVCLGWSPPAVDYKWKGQNPEVNVFDDYDQDFQEGKWKDYKEPSNVFDLLLVIRASCFWNARISFCMAIMAAVSRGGSPL